MTEKDKIRICFADGKEVLFKNFFKDNFAKFCVFASRFIADQFVCEDIVQESFLKIWESENKSYESDLSLMAFMYKTIRNKCLNHLKHVKIKDKYNSDMLLELESEEYLLTNVVNEETNYLLYKAIKTLSPQCGQVIKLHLKGLKNKDMAEDLNLSVATVKTHKMVAYRHLREELGEIKAIVTAIILTDF